MTACSKCEAKALFRVTMRAEGRSNSLGHVPEHDEALCGPHAGQAVEFSRAVALQPIEAATEEVDR